MSGCRLNPENLRKFLKGFSSLRSFAIIVEDDDYEQSWMSSCTSKVLPCLGMKVRWLLMYSKHLPVLYCTNSIECLEEEDLVVMDNEDRRMREYTLGPSNGTRKRKPGYLHAREVDGPESDEEDMIESRRRYP